MRASPTTSAMALLLGLALPACAIFKTTPVDTGQPADDGGSDDGGSEDGGTDDGGDGGGTADGGGDGGGTDADGGGGDGGGGDGGTEDPICDLDIGTGAPRQACVTATLACGEERVDTLVGGEAAFGAEEYEAWYCSYTGGDPWAGKERVYAFTHPGTGNVTFTLDSPCAEMDLAVLRWGYWATDGECPSGSSTLVSECEMDDGAGGGSVTVWNNEPADYLVIVDGVDGALDNFSLSISCE
ncbi:hypothetical protein L6R53_05375 [Myxococcota bacterium]|nr:hypothetical protein [Myxococcota bacterium]